jgi:hypothetical protein
MTTEEKVKQIKRSFRLLMNGEASKYMRENGIEYHLNWGVAFSDLRMMAEEYGKDYHLAVQLWMENIRECKILATLIMPAEEMTPQLADLWMGQAQTLEMAEMLAHNLFQHLDFAASMAFRWIASSLTLHQVCGYHIISGRLRQGMTPDTRGIAEIIDQATTALRDESMPVRHAAYNCLNRLASLGEDYAKVVEMAMQ